MLSESSDIPPKSSLSLMGAGFFSFRLTSGWSGCFAGFCCAGASTGLGRKANEERTQSPTDDEMVAVQMEKTSN